jgi:hypothetical protein
VRRHRHLTKSALSLALFRSRPARIAIIVLMSG